LRVLSSDIAFEIGFVFRELFQISENQKSVKKAIELIKARIILKGFLPGYKLTEKPSLTSAHTVISKKDCKLCDYLATCVGAATFLAFPDLKTMTFGDQGCPRDWKIEETQDLALEVDHARPTITTSAI
jgi:hypothetical protein